MEESLLYTSISLLTLLIAIKITLKMTKKPRYKNLPPSPPALPVIGHLHLLKSTPLHQVLHRLSAQYGGDKGVLFLRFGTRQVAVVSAPSVVEECFTKNDVVLANRPPLIMGKHVGYNHTTMVASPYGDHWRNLRRIGAVEIFSASRLGAFVSTRRDEVNRLLLRIHRASLVSGRVELRSTFSNLTFNVIMRMVAGKRYYGDDVAEDDSEARQFREIITEIFVNAGAGNPGDFLPILNWGPKGYEKRVEKLAKKTDKFLQRLIDEHRDNARNNTMIDHLLSLQESQPEYYTDQIIKGFILVLILAATDTSAVTLEWALSNLLNHPEELKKAKVEIDHEIGQQRLVEETDVPKLGYLQNIISESMRISPAAPMLVPHYASDDCTIGGYDVPRGTILLVNAWAIHRDPLVWADAESFRPERFREVGAGDGQGYKHMPFGVGRRACPGVGLAQRVVGLTLASLIQCFEWERVGEEMIDMTEGKGLTMPKAVPLEAICKARPIIEAVQLSDSSDITA